MPGCKHIIARYITTSIFAGLFLTGLNSASVNALSFTSYDPRSMAMAGTGVATTKAYNASLFNPALLSSNAYEEQDTRVFLRSYLGARLIDRDNFIDSIERYQDNNYEAAVDDAVNNLNQQLSAKAVTSDDLRVLTGSGNALLGDLNQLSNKPLRAGISYGITGGKAGNTWGMAAHARNYYIAGGIIQFTEDDQVLLQELFNFTDRLAVALDYIDDYTGLIEDNLDTLQIAWDAGGSNAVKTEFVTLTQGTPLEPDVQQLNNLLDAFETIYVASDTDIITIDDLARMPELLESLNSTLSLQGAIVSEKGVSFAKTLNNFPVSSAGFTIKEIRFEAIDFITRINDANTSTFDRTEHSRSYTDMNLDMGVTRQLDNEWKLGLVVRNLLSKNYTTVLGNQIKLRPVSRIGVAYEQTAYTLAVDLDITRNDPLGFDPDKRYLAFGTELRGWEHTALRAGMRHNIIDNTELFTLGFGLGYRYAYFDIALAGKGDELGLSLQLGFVF